MTLAATTMAGYRTVAPKRKRHRDRILDALELAGARGLTAGELKAYFPEGTPEGSIGGRINELEDEALIFRAGDERIYTVTGCAQQIIRLAEYSATTLMPKSEVKMTPYLKGFIKAIKIVRDHTPEFKGSPAALAVKAELERIKTRGEKVKK